MLTIIPKSSPEIALPRPTSLSAQAGAFAGRIVSSARATGLVSAIFGAGIAMLSNSPAGLCAGGAAFALILSAKQVFEIKRLNAWHAESSVNLEVAGKEIDELRSKNNNLVKDSKAQAATITEQSSRIELIVSNLRGLVIENTTLKSNVADLKSRVADLANINSSALAMIEPFRTENTSLKATAATDKSQLEKLKAENQELATANRALMEMVDKFKQLGLERLAEIKAKAQSHSEDVEPVPEDVVPVSESTSVSATSSAASSVSDDLSQDVVPVSKSTSATSSVASSISDELSVDAEIAQMMAEIGEDPSA